MSTHEAVPSTEFGTLPGKDDCRMHDCPRCGARTRHVYRLARGTRLAVHAAKVLGSLCTMGMAFPHEFAHPESPARCEDCGTVASVPAF